MIENLSELLEALREIDPFLATNLGLYDELPDTVIIFFDPFKGEEIQKLLKDNNIGGWTMGSKSIHFDSKKMGWK